MTVSDPLTRTHEARRLGRVHLARDGLHETRAPAIASMPLRAHPTSRVSPWDIPSATTILSVMVALRALHPGLFNGGGSGKCPNLVHCRPSHYRPDHSGSWTEHPISHLFMDAISRVTPRLYKPIYGSHTAPASPHAPQESTWPEPFSATSRDLAPPVDLSHPFLF